MRNTFAKAFYEIAKKDPRLYLVVADISPVASAAAFQEEYPERFVNVGVAEQNMAGIAALPVSAVAQQQQQQAAMETQFLRGALDDANYMMATWAGAVQYNPMHAASMAAKFINTKPTTATIPQINADKPKQIEIEHPLTKKHKGNGLDAHPS